MIIEPRFNVMRVDFSGIIESLERAGIGSSVVSRIAGVARETVCGWRLYGKRPRDIFQLFIVVDFACRFLSDRLMFSFGVTNHG